MLSKLRNHFFQFLAIFRKIPSNCQPTIPHSIQDQKEIVLKNVFLDLSFPPANSVNDDMDKNRHFNFEIKLAFLGEDT